MYENLLEKFKIQALVDAVLRILGCVFIFFAAFGWKVFSKIVIDFIPEKYNINSFNETQDNPDPLIKLIYPDPLNWLRIGTDILLMGQNRTNPDQDAPWTIKLPIIIAFVFLFFILVGLLLFLRNIYTTCMVPPNDKIFNDFKQVTSSCSSNKEFVKEISLTSLEEEFGIHKISRGHQKIIRAQYQKLLADSLSSSSNESQTIVKTSKTKLYALATETNKAILFLGYGTSQYKNLKKAKKLMDNAIRALDQKYGEGEWFFVYGGDAYEAEKHDLTHLIKHAHDKHDIDICAIQHKGVEKRNKKANKNPSQIFGLNVKYVHWYKKDVDNNGKTVYSGYDNTGGKLKKSNLRGASKIYFGNESFLSAVVAIGGGAFSLQDVKLGLYYKKPLLWMKCATEDVDLVWKGLNKRKCSSLELGPIHSFVENAKANLGRKGNGMWYEPASNLLELNDSRLRPYPIDNDMEEEIETTVSSVESHHHSHHGSISRGRSRSRR